MEMFKKKCYKFDILFLGIIELLPKILKWKFVRVWINERPPFSLFENGGDTEGVNFPLKASSPKKKRFSLEFQVLPEILNWSVFSLMAACLQTVCRCSVRWSGWKGCWQITQILVRGGMSCFDSRLNKFRATEL